MAHHGWFAFALILSCGLADAAPQPTPAQQPRQFYGKWERKAGNSYYHRTYVFQPKRGGAYKQHYAIYYPRQKGRKFVYFYNPEKRTYWGRYDVTAHTYSTLAPQDRGPRLTDIPAEAFPPGGDMPPLPGCDDNLPMDEPVDRDDPLPPDEGGPDEGPPVVNPPVVDPPVVHPPVVCPPRVVCPPCPPVICYPPVVCPPLCHPPVICRPPVVCPQPVFQPQIRRR